MKIGTMLSWRNEIGDLEVDPADLVRQGDVPSRPTYEQLRQMALKSAGGAEVIWQHANGVNRLDVFARALTGQVQRTFIELPVGSDHSLLQMVEAAILVMGDRLLLLALASYRLR